MRYLSIFLLLFFSSFTFSQIPQAQFQGNFCDTAHACASFTAELNARHDVGQYAGACFQNGGPNFACAPIYQKCSPPLVNHGPDPALCVPVCQPPQKLNISGSLDNMTAQCIDDGPTPNGPEDCPADSMVYDPVTGTMVCPGSGDGSSSASSQNCVVPGDYDGDCIPDDSSSAASSGAASSVAPSSGANSSGNDGNNDSGGSASSSGSASGDGDGGSTPGTGGGGSGPGTGTGTTPGGSSAGSNTSSGSNNSWTPNSGYGNWIPVNPGSNCPNKYQDKEGQWWCWGGPSDSSAGSASSGSAGSGSSGSSSSTGYSGGEDCESEPVCPEGEANCLILVQSWHTRCGGEPLDDKIFELPEEGDGDELSFSNSLTNFKKELEKLPNTQAITEFFRFNASGSCPVWSVNVLVFEVVIDQQCSPDIPWGIISGVLIAVASLVAARVALT